MSESNTVRIEDAARSEDTARTRGASARRRSTTRWGDREQRRIDILEAARSRITEQGYLSLSMRDLAAGAGVSPATLYSYFATKEALFATLYAEAIRAHTEAFRPVADAGLDLTGLLSAVIDAHLGLFRSYGRHFPLWSATRHDPDQVAAERKVPRELVAELRSVTLDHNRLLMGAIRAAAAREGRHVADERLVPGFLWSALNGLADHFTTERRALDPFPASRLIAFAADRLALAITDPD
ncbi:MAG TPA: helix-turn-helix domain-containing protein [Acidimicrobiales bacterium]|nr:helix-turn-helix domain-containing protein [Acidimicrobiales bacterium]